MPETMHTLLHPPDLKANVLLVDDLPANLLVLEVLLADLGHNLVRAQSGEEALRRLREEEFALVLLDVRMPGLDGFQTAERIRSQDRSRHTPVILITAYDDDEFPTTEAYKLGAVDYLHKPLVPEILRAKVSGLVDLFLEKKSAEWHADQLRLLVQATTDYAIFMLDPDGRVATWNTGAERIKGYRADEIVGQHFSRFYTPDAVARGWPDHELATAGRDGRFEDEGWRVRKDGSLFWANVVITALRDDGGHLRGFSKVTRDLTERKRAEDALRQAHAGLEEKVRARTAELTAANAALRAEVEERRRLEQELQKRVGELAEADRHKNEFLAMLAHELRNPLAPIRNAVQILKMPGADRRVTEHARGMMERQLHHLVRLVDDLLDVSRIMRGKITLDREPIDLATVVGRATETVQPTIDAYGHELIVALPDRPVMLEGDLVRLAQVVGNLLTNAAKYTEKAGRIWLTAGAEGDEVVLRVRDSGVGIAPDLLPRVFDLFVQAERSLARSNGGLGVGLTLVKRLVEMHGGTVEARSAGIGHGSEFVVRLPVLRAEPDGADCAPFREVARPSAPARRVLVVDDNVDAADSAAILLRLWGHEVQTVYDGLGVLPAVRDFRPDVILLDIGLPGMTGYEVAEQLRAQPGLGSVVLAAMTGYGQEEDRRRAREAGFNVHLTKPLDPTTLQALVTAPAS
jgi:PAS domain S-box-containing protein